MRLNLHTIGVKTIGVCLSTDGKLCYVTPPLAGPASAGFLYETFPPLPVCFSCFRVVPRILILCTAFLFHQVLKLFSQFIPSSNRLCI